MSAVTSTPLTTTANGRNHAPRGGKVTVVILGNKSIEIPFNEGMTVGDAAEKAGQESSDPRIDGKSVSPNRRLQPGEEVTLVQRQAGG